MCVCNFYRYIFSPPKLFKINPPLKRTKAANARQTIKKRNKAAVPERSVEGGGGEVKQKRITSDQGWLHLSHCMKSGNGGDGGGGGVVRRSLYTKSIHATAEMCNKRERTRESEQERRVPLCVREGGAQTKRH